MNENISKLTKLLAVIDPQIKNEDLIKVIEGSLFLLLKIQIENDFLKRQVIYL